MTLLGIDIGGSGMKAAPVNVATGQLVDDRHRIDTPQPATPKAMARVVKKLVRAFDYQGPVGVAFPARIKRGVALTATNIHKRWLGTNGEALFAEAAGGPVRLLNDADAAGVAEMAFGAGKGRDGVVLMLTFGTGIGSGLFMDGMLVPNTEFGHFELDGRNAERYCADSARRRKDLSWEEWAGRVQRYLDRVEFLLHPDVIILGGGVSRPRKLRQYIHLLKTQADLVPAQLQNEAGIIGAAVAAKSLLSAGDTIHAEAG